MKILKNCSQNCWVKHVNRRKSDSWLNSRTCIFALNSRDSQKRDEESDSKYDKCERDSKTSKKWEFFEFQEWNHFTVSFLVLTKIIEIFIRRQSDFKSEINSWLEEMICMQMYDRKVTDNRLLIGIRFFPSRYLCFEKFAFKNSKLFPSSSRLPSRRKSIKLQFFLKSFSLIMNECEEKRNKKVHPRLKSN